MVHIITHNSYDMISYNCIYTVFSFISMHEYIYIAYADHHFQVLLSDLSMADLRL